MARGVCVCVCFACSEDKEGTRKVPCPDSGAPLMGPPFHGSTTHPSGHLMTQAEHLAREELLTSALGQLSKEEEHLRSTAEPLGGCDERARDSTAQSFHWMHPAREPQGMEISDPTSSDPTCGLQGVRLLGFWSSVTQTK